jgi:hypothetical protein
MGKRVAYVLDCTVINSLSCIFRSSILPLLFSTKFLLMVQLNHSDANADTLYRRESGCFVTRYSIYLKIMSLSLRTLSTYFQVLKRWANYM